MRRVAIPMALASALLFAMPVPVLGADEEAEACVKAQIAVEEARQVFAKADAEADVAEAADKTLADAQAKADETDADSECDQATVARQAYDDALEAARDPEGPGGVDDGGTPEDPTDDSPVVTPAEQAQVNELDRAADQAEAECEAAREADDAVEPAQVEADKADAAVERQQANDARDALAAALRAKAEACGHPCDHECETPSEPVRDPRACEDLEGAFFTRDFPPLAHLDTDGDGIACEDERVLNPGAGRTPTPVPVGGVATGDGSTAGATAGES